MDDFLRLSKPARRLGVHPGTLRVWADTGEIAVTWVGSERPFAAADVEAMRVTPGGEPLRLEGRCVRVSGGTGEESSLAALEAELGAASAGEVARVFRGPGVGNELYTSPQDQHELRRHQNRAGWADCRRQSPRRLIPAPAMGVGPAQPG